MASSAKKWWLATGAVSAVVAGLIIFCVPECNRAVKDVIRDFDKKDPVANVDNTDKIRQLTDSIVELKQDLRETQEMLDDCRQGAESQKKVESKPQSKAKVKPQQIQLQQKKQPQPKKKKNTPKKVRENKNVKTQKQVSTPCVNINSSNNNGAIVVGNNNNVVVQSPTPAVVADSLNTFKRTTTVTVTVKTKTKQRVYY